MTASLDTDGGFARLWQAFDAGEILSACAWCGRVRIDETWLRPSHAALAAIDQRLTLSHSICEVCIDTLGPAGRVRSAGRTAEADGAKG